MAAGQCVVVLDTNVLHCVKLYLSYAKGRRRYPYAGVQWSSTEAYIGRRVAEQNVRDALVRGGRVLHFMQRNGAEVSRCSAVELEWFRLEAYSYALDTAVRRSRVRGRWFSRFDDRQVNWWMTPEDRQFIASSLEETFEALDSFGIRVSDLDPSASTDVVWLARGIMTIVYMDPLDSVVFAHALVATATHLVTSDGPFKNMINRFQNPTEEGARADSDALSSLVQRCTGLELTPKDFPMGQHTSRLAP